MHTWGARTLGVGGTMSSDEGPCRVREQGGTKREKTERGIKGASCVKQGECMWVWMCAFPSDLLSLPVDDEGTWLSMFIFYVGPACGCCWKQCLVCANLCDGRVIVLPVWCQETCSALLLVEPAKEKVAATSLSSKREALGIGVGTGGQAGGVLGREVLEEAVIS